MQVSIPSASIVDLISPSASMSSLSRFDEDCDRPSPRCRWVQFVTSRRRRYLAADMLRQMAGKPIIRPAMATARAIVGLPGRARFAHAGVRDRLSPQPPHYCARDARRHVLGGFEQPPASGG